MSGLIQRIAVTTRSERVRKVAGNFGWLMGQRGVTLLLSLTVSVWVARYLGPELFGVMNYAVAFVALFGAFTYLGISGMVVRDLVERPEERDEILGTVFLLKIAGAFLAILVIGLISWALESGQDRLLIGILSVGMIFESVTVIAFWYQARVESRHTVRASVTAAVVGSALKCALILLEASLVAFVVATVLQQVLNTILLFVVYQRQGGSVRGWSYSGARAKSLLSRSWPLLLSSVGSIIYLKIDQIMLEHLSGSIEVGIYAVAARLSEVWYFVPTALAGSLFPQIIRYRQLSPAEYEARMQRIYRIMVLASLAIAVPVTLTARPLIQFLFGSEYAPAASVLMIHIWTCPAIFMAGAFSKWLISEDLLMFSLTRHGLGAVANVVLNAILIPRHGAIGAALATLVSYTVASYLACFTDRRTFRTGVMMTRALIFPFKDVFTLPVSAMGTAGSDLQKQDSR